MSRVDDDAIKLLVGAGEETTASFPFSSTVDVSAEKADMYSRAALGDENRLSGRLCSKLKIEYIYS